MKKDREKTGGMMPPEEIGEEPDFKFQEELPSREEQFNALIRGEFKDLFDKAVKEAMKESGNDLKAVLRKEKAARKYEKWLDEAQETRQLYPGFDLGRELKNGQFCELLKCGVPVKSAFELVHRDELMKLYAKQLEESITKRILAGTLRPRESAIAPNSSTVIKSDTSRMSKDARQEIIRRVQRGEKISF